MIVRCPSCASRRDVPSLQPGSGGAVVDCFMCGHEWIEGKALPANPDASAASDARLLTADSAKDLHPLVEAARVAQGQFAALRRARRFQWAAWTGLAAVALAPLPAALAFPERVVVALPAANSLYAWMGHEVNVYGLEIRQVDLQHLIVDGRKVIAVKGELTNVSSADRKIPWLRFGLRSKDNVELYHWTLDTEVRPLKPGESTSFVTRLASPPEAARNLEIRFARADEIGSNNGP